MQSISSPKSSYLSSNYYKSKKDPDLEKNSKKGNTILFSASMSHHAAALNNSREFIRISNLAFDNNAAQQAKRLTHNIEEVKLNSSMIFSEEVNLEKNDKVKYTTQEASTQYNIIDFKSQVNDNVIIRYLKSYLRQCRQINLPHNTMQRICTAARNDLVFLA
jgi:hypothetical protein